MIADDHHPGGIADSSIHYPPKEGLVTRLQYYIRQHHAKRRLIEYGTDMRT